MRKTGWYWCQWDKDGEWECSEWRGYNWDDNEPSCQPVVVGPRIPTPDEDWQAVPKTASENMKDAATWGLSPHDADEIWSDMLAAAPRP